MLRSGGLYVVTGGAGFIGSCVVAALAQRQERVVVVDRLRSDDKWRNIASNALHDIIHPDAFADWRAAHAGEIAAIVHMGAISATTERDGDRLVSENIRLTLDLWDFATTATIPLVYASSAATYGDGLQGFDDENTEANLSRLKPLNGYGWSKHAVDRRILRDVREGLPQPPKWAGLKFFNVYGPNEYHKGPMRSVVHQIHGKLVAGQPAALFRSARPDYADGGQMRDFVYVKDCVASILWLLDNDFPSGLYNLGSGKARTWLDLVNAVFSAMGRKPEIEFIDMPAELKDRYQYFTQARMDRLRSAGCTLPFHSLEDGVADYVRNHLSKADPYL